MEDTKKHYKVGQYLKIINSSISYYAKVLAHRERKDGPYECKEYVCQHNNPHDVHRPKTCTCTDMLCKGSNYIDCWSEGIETNANVFKISRVLGRLKVGI